jgi:cytochrome oxidase assembly protein ShyY1
VAGFRPGLGPTLLTFFVAACFAALGTWQVQRHLWREGDLATKRARLEQPTVSLADALRDPAGHAFRRSRVRGRFELADTVVVSPVARGHELGARIVTPLRLEGEPEQAPRLLVARGWVPAEAVSRFLPPDPAAPAGALEAGTQAALGDAAQLEGVVLELAVGEGVPGSRAARQTHRSRFNPDRPGLVAKIQAQLPYPLLPVLLQATQSEAGGLPIGEPVQPVSPVDHRTYAFTWFAASALALVTWFEYGRRRARELAT